MKYLIRLLACLFVATNMAAQEKALTVEDLIPGGKNHANFIPKTDYKVQWYGDELLFSNENEAFIAHPQKPDGKKPLLTKSELNNLLNEKEISLNRLSFVSLDNHLFATVFLSAKEKQVYLDLKNKTVAFEIQRKKDWANTDFCTGNKRLAFTLKNNLYVSNPEGKIIPVAEDADPYIVYGQAVHRNEFGIMKGTFWSPDGNYLAFYRMDETRVGDYPLVDISKREAELKNIKYPMAGMTSHEVTVGIYELSTGKTVYLKTGEPKDRYLTNISWSPNEKQIYIAELNREQNHLQLNQYDVGTGEKVRTLLEEHNDRYVEPEHPLLFLKKTPEHFIWQSKRNGYNHLYLYDTDGKLIRPLTSGDYDITDVLGVDADEKHIFVVSNAVSPIEFQAYKVNLNTAQQTQITFEAGVHHPQPSLSGKYLLDRFSNRTTPLNVDLINTSVSAKVRPVRLQTAENPYKEYALPDISLGSVKADDGKTDLYYHLIKPADFDPAKKYPVVIYVYGGPHSQMIKNNWLASARGWSLYMAQRGYLVFSMDNRGTSNRGFAFESVTHRQLGVIETADQMCGVKFLQSLPYVDKERIGVHGWSYGGFMTANLMLRHPETFKVGVAGGPVTDWKYYEVMYGERYMDTPQENPEGYGQTDMNGLAGNLKGRFLIIHGDMDPTVVWQNSLSFLKACITARTYPDYFVYPGHGHNMGGVDRVHLHEKITRYFEDYLK
ncbi:MAG: S9 family peptidase [Dysgonamonadaceae bacterium]|jgi:dipeptidyl-peptidase-4|nr:S9 family peptidase [Dysgonamonadaceae bacterium]